MRFRMLLLLAGVGLLCSGCVEYEERMMIHGDGSGELRVHYSVPEGVRIDDGLRAETEEELLEELKDRFVTGDVKLTHYSLDFREGKKLVDFTLEFRRVTDLNDCDPYVWEWRFDLGREDGYLRVEREVQIDAGDWDKEPESSFERWLKEQLSERIFEGIKFRFEIAFPSEVRESNADWVRSGRIAVWSFRLADVVGRNRLLQFAVGR